MQKEKKILDADTPRGGGNTGNVLGNCGNASKHGRKGRITTVRFIFLESVLCFELKGTK